MARAAFGATVEYSTNAGSSYTTIGELKDVSIKVDGKEIDTTSFDSSGWEEGIPGLLKWSGKAGGFYASASATETAILGIVTGRTLVRLRIRPIVGSGNMQLVGDAYLGGWDVKLDVKDAIARDLEIRGSGALSPSNQ